MRQVPSFPLFIIIHVRKLPVSMSCILDKTCCCTYSLYYLSYSNINNFQLNVSVEKDSSLLCPCTRTCISQTSIHSLPQNAWCNFWFRSIIGNHVFFPQLKIRSFVLLADLNKVIHAFVSSCTLSFPQQLIQNAAAFYMPQEKWPYYSYSWCPFTRFRSIL